MTTPRANIVRGPAIVQFKSQTFYSKGDVIVRPVRALTPIETAAWGQVDSALNTFLWSLTFTPSGQWLSGHLAVLWPYASATRGTSVFGSSDSDINVHSFAGQKLTLHAGAVTQMPTLFFGPTETIAGPVTMEAIGADDTAWSDASKFATLASVAFSDTSFDKSTVKLMAYTGTWTAPLASFDTEGGIRVTPTANIVPDMTAADGIVDKVVDGVGITVGAIPVGVSESDLLTALDIQGSGVARGTLLSDLSHAADLSIGAGSGNPAFAVTTAHLVDAGLVYGSRKRVGEVAWQATRDFTAGVADALWTATHSAA